MEPKKMLASKGKGKASSSSAPNTAVVATIAGLTHTHSFAFSDEALSRVSVVGLTGGGMDTKAVGEWRSVVGTARVGVLVLP
ncbi:uncharacterized protein A4U43_C04F29880 [Asparagus officinalis]|uniref:Uncharacterized protein n=1 Tax=Asparagus officinalis TaxID=4686 RepID=A0A5P1F4N9_ASPOF|nr:uncharacterized protein A4U43_C04F29880 [Asparagus officinalis]